MTEIFHKYYHESVFTQKLLNGFSTKGFILPAFQPI
jgi:hypothetical protein